VNTELLFVHNLSDLYDDFNLPEELVKYGQEQVERELEQASSEKEIPEEEKEKRRQEGIENAKIGFTHEIHTGLDW